MRKVVTRVKVLKGKLEGPHFNCQGRKPEAACTKGLGGKRHQGREWPPRFLLCAQHFGETKHTEEGIPSAGKGLWVYYIQELQDITPS